MQFDFQKLATTQALVLDCDGVLTPGDLYYDSEGKRILRFNALDGTGIAMLSRCGVHVAVLSGRPVDIAELRFKELGIKEFRGNCRDKGLGLIQLCADLGVGVENTVYVGDDMMDIPAMVRAGVAVAVSSAAPEVIEVAHWVTKCKGGKGAVREVCEGILKARGDWQKWVERLKQVTN